jgi:hypothetical protein
LLIAKTWGAGNTGKCGAAREVLASHYSIGARTASGERFDPQGLTAVSHDYPLGTTINDVIAFLLLRPTDAFNLCTDPQYL